jgi:predicted transcriptional regulator
MSIKDLPNLYLQAPKLNQLNILKEVAANASITQAELANQCSLSVAMVNNYMKELCRIGLIEYHRKSTKSVTYHLTALGTQQLESLQSELIGAMVEMYIAAKKQIRNRIVDLAQESVKRVILYGSGHLAQLVFHALEREGISIIGICDDDIEVIGSDFCGREVISPLQIRFIAPDAVIIADSHRTEEICKSLSSLSERGIGLIRLDGHMEVKSAQSPKPKDATISSHEDLQSEFLTSI